MGVTQTILEITENNTLKWYGHGLRIEDNRWRKHIMAWSLEARGPEMNYLEREVERVMKQKNVTPEDAVDRQLWRKATENQ
jgi:hypothetical protein